jgi:O-succinylhomoserine sulfhydrylase
MRAHSEKACEISAWLSQRDDLDAVHFTGDPLHPQAELIAKQQTGHGGLLSFEIRGGQPEAWRFIDSLRLISNTTNIGDTKSMITHPATTTHGRLSPEAKAAAGISPNLVRLSVGLEDTTDLIADLHQALRTLR